MHRCVLFVFSSPQSSRLPNCAWFGFPSISLLHARSPGFPLPEKPCVEFLAHITSFFSFTKKKKREKNFDGKRLQLC